MAEPSNGASSQWCQWCGVDQASQEYRVLVDARAAIAECDEKTQRIAARRQEWVVADRQWRAHIAQLMATPARSAAPSTAVPAATAPSATTRSASMGPASQIVPHATPPAPASAPSGASAPFPVPETTPQRHVAAPVLLGIGGAALLIVSALVFVAFSWQTLSPWAVALMVGTLAAGVGALAVWLGRKSLPATSGAAGVVAMGFTFVAVTALQPPDGVLLVVSVGLVLSVLMGVGLGKLGVSGVTSVASFLCGPAAITLVLSTLDWAPEAAWLVGLVGAAGALTVAVTHRWWPTVWTRRWVRIGASGAAAVAVAVASVIAALDASPDGLTLVGAVPALLVLAWLGWHWKRTPLVAFALTAPLWAGAIALTSTEALVAPWAMSVTAVWAAVVVTGSVLDGARKAALWSGAAVWTIPVSLTMLGLAGPSIPALIFAESVPAEVPVTGVTWCLVAIVLWAVARSVSSADAASVAAIAGSVAATVGPVATLTGLRGYLDVGAGGASSATGASEAWFVYGAVAAGAIVTALTVRYWPTHGSRWTAGIGAIVVVTALGLAGSLALASGVQWPAVGAVVVALVLLATGSRWSQTAVAGPIVFVLSFAIGATVVALTEAELWGVAAAAVVAALAVWAAGIVREAWGGASRVACAFGAVPALLGGATIAVTAFALGLLSFVPNGAATAASARAFAADNWWAPTGVVCLIALAWALRSATRITSAGREGLLAASAALAALAVVPATSAVQSLLEPSTDTSLLVFPVVFAVASWWALAVAPTPVARTVVWITGAVLVSLASLNVVAALALGDVSAVLGLAVVILGLAALVIAGLWRPLIVTAPIVAIATLVPAALMFNLGASAEWALLATAAATAVAAWVLRIFPRIDRLAAGFGLIPGLAATAGLVVWATFEAIERWGSGSIANASDGTWWVAATAGVVGIGVVSVREWRQIYAPVCAALLVMATVSFDAPWTWASLVVAGIGVVGADALGWRLPWSRRTALALAASGAVWAGGDGWAWGLVLLAVALVSERIALTSRHRYRVVLLSVAVLSSAAAVWTLLSVAGAPREFAALVAVIVGLSMALAPRMLAVDSRRVSLVTTAVILTVLMPVAAGSLAGAGTVLVVMAGGWWLVALKSDRRLVWCAYASLSLGIGVWLGAGGVGVVEAYLAVPAVVALTYGIRSLVRDTQQRSVRALWPGLVLTLTPSLVMLVVEPDSLIRVMALTAGVVALAVVGVLQRWIAPVGAAAIAAVVLALTQAGASDSLVTRWVAFGLVGILLIALAATWEKLRKLR
ncbi:SCO7613 C-terminal domain-containing membrane protein [Demequina sediminicola]|uniref:SCO7613 C-terminal domain-containing membrane protein n=1 Tax=Demequina sediminicola TaxID=1095026 RepID=UPI00128AEBE3|nr:hypothetical protein [Demequina sediminicola]